jgi:phage recombination protein Bet
MPDTAMMVAKSQGMTVVNQDWERPENLELIKQTVAPGLTDPEFLMFCHVARVRRLDPLQKQIYAMKRRTWNAETGQYEERMVLQVGIDGFRSIANRTGLYMPSDKLPLVEDPGGPNLRVTVWVKKWHELSAQWMEFGATAYYREFVQTKKNKATGKIEPVSMWEKMALGQTEKCAEAKAIRRGWPEELGQFYIPEEVSSSIGVDVMLPENPKLDKTRRDLGTLKVSSEPNRGHGHEGTQRSAEQTLCVECRTLNGHTPDCSLNPKARVERKEGTQRSPERAGAKKSKREAWEGQPGHDPKIHISFDDAVTLFDIQRKLKLTDDQVKAMLDKEFEIQHRYLIRQDEFQLVLDTIQKQFGEKPKENGDAPPDDVLA